MYAPADSRRLPRRSAPAPVRVYRRRCIDLASARMIAAIARYGPATRAPLAADAFPPLFVNVLA